MKSIDIDPVWLDVGGPALVAGLVLGAFVAWLIARRRRQLLEAENAGLSERIKNQETLQNVSAPGRAKDERAERTGQARVERA